MMKRLIVLIITMLLLTSCGTKNDDSANSSRESIDQEIAFANNALGFDLIKTVHSNDDGNIFVSPTSLFMALSMVYNGAGGETRQEIADALKLSDIEAEQLNKANAQLMELLNDDSREVELDVGNSIWLNDRYHFQERFVKESEDHFQAEIEEIDIGDDESVDQINNWVKAATNEKIDQIIEAPIDPYMVALLVNAIYFKGAWTYPFDEKATTEDVFYLENGSSKNVSLMKMKRPLLYLEHDNFQAVSLPYGENEEMSMQIFLPKEAIAFEDFQEQLTNENWQMWTRAFQQQEGTLMIPKFQLEYETKLNEALESFGMITAFDENKANFENMVEEDDPIWISEVKQKTFIDVNEEGTEAAGVTSVEMRTTSAPIDSFEMEVNRPFYLMITDEETGMILFMGAIMNP